MIQFHIKKEIEKKQIITTEMLRRGNQTYNIERNKFND